MRTYEDLGSGPRRYWLLALLTFGSSAILVLVVAPGSLGREPADYSVATHLAVTTVVAAAAFLLTVPVSLAARRSKDGGLVSLAAGCLAVGILMLAHGLLIVRFGDIVENRWADRLAWLALIANAGALALATAPDARLSRWLGIRPVGVIGGVGVLLVLPTSVLVLGPQIVTPRSLPWEESAGLLASTAIFTLLVPTAMLYWRRWRLGGDSILLGLAASAVLTVAATMCLLLQGWWGHIWWVFEAYLVSSVLVVMVAVMLGGRRLPGPRRWDSILAADPLVHISTGYCGALLALVSAVETKDVYIHGHSRRTAEMAVRIGSGLRLGGDALRSLGRGAILHDVGKIGIPEAVLNKPATLNASEREDIERHPALGAELARSTTSLSDTIDVILHHHEWWDGTGYPDGLAGREIPLLARICAVADVWDALTSERAGRPPWSQVDALHHIAAAAGTHFDPAIVDVFVDHVCADLGLAPPLVAAGS